MTPTYPRYLPDRDKENDWFLDQDVTFYTHNGHKITLLKGFKWDSHSVPFLMRWWFPRYIYSEQGTPNDIYAAMVHDALIAAEHWLPYPRQFVDYEYWRFMQMPEYTMCTKRAKWMPRAVTKFGNLFYWRDYRGEVPEYAEYIIVGAQRVV